MSYSDVSDASFCVVKAMFWPLMLSTMTVTGDCVTGSMLGYLWGVGALCAQIIFWEVSLSALLYKGCVLPCSGVKV